MSKTQVIFSFSILTFIWFIHFFREASILSNIIIYFIFTPLTFYLGYYLKNKSLLIRVIYPIILILVGVFGFNNFWFIIINRNASEIAISPKIEFSIKNNKVRIDTIQDKVIVLDFWTTSCGKCFEKFPDFEKLYYKYQNNSNVLLYAVNIPVRRDTVGYAKKRIEKYNYNFPVLYSDSDTVPKQLGFDKYPHMVILKNGKIRFNGYLNLNEKNVFFYDIENEIEKLIKE
ncbi:TlpA family protein disulfide reductase [Polaribacter sp.]|uniref:TlpA family protein disulfide reductase n=1 Tax=Polaribacter sp. TaxID=1920175 RepID=UPI003F6A14B2